MESLSLKAKDLPCLFNFLVNKYLNSQLLQCEVKESQRWRYASGDVAINKIKAMVKYFSELSSLLNSLKNYSICEKHYNQIVAKNFLIKQLEVDNQIYLLSEEENEENERKKLRLSDNEGKFCDFEI